MCFDQYTLPNGLRIIGERIDFFHSVSVGLWLGAGSQYELPPEAGLSHLLEHMVFKGTRRRTARQIAEEMDAVGGQLNAFTARECTCFYAKVVDEHLPLAMDVLADLVTEPAFDPVELEKEKGVVIEEINMSEDSPDDLCSDLLLMAHYGDQPVARPILGNIERVQSYQSDDLRRYWREMYKPNNAVLALAGNYDWQSVLALAEKLLGGWPAGNVDRRPIATNPVSPGVLVREKDIEQVQICLGFPGVPIGDDSCHELATFNFVYGGAMSSRLFQKIREESGLAYNVCSYPNTYLDTGMLVVYAAANAENAGAVIDMIRSETRAIVDSGMTHEEYTMAWQQLKAMFVMGQESISSHMTSLGRRLLLSNETRTDDEIIARINAIEYEPTNAMLRDVLSAPFSVALVGRGVEDIAAKL